MFYGREEILEQLDAQLASPIASLVTCRGRRRIGKSTLIEEFARRSKVRFIKLEGLSPREADSNQKQLTAFARQLSEQRDLVFLFSTPEANRYGRIDTVLLGNSNVLGFNLLLNIKAKRPCPTPSLRLWRFPSALRVCGTAVQSPSALILIALPDEPLDHALFFPRSFLDVPGQEQPGKYNNNQKDHFASPFPNTLV